MSIIPSKMNPPTSGIEEKMLYQGQEIPVMTFTSLDYQTKQPMKYGIIFPPFTSHKAVKVSVFRFPECF